TPADRGAEVDGELQRRLARLGKRLDGDDGADADIDLAEVVIGDHRFDSRLGVVGQVFLACADEGGGTLSRRGDDGNAAQRKGPRRRGDGRPFGNSGRLGGTGRCRPVYFLPLTFGCSAVLTSSKLSTTRLLRTETASSPAFCTISESSRTLASAVSKAVLASSACFTSLSSVVPAAVNSFEAFDSSSTDSRTNSGWRRKTAWTPSKATRLAAVSASTFLRCVAIAASTSNSGALPLMKNLPNSPAALLKSV